MQLVAVIEQVWGGTWRLPLLGLGGHNWASFEILMEAMIM